MTRLWLRWMRKVTLPKILQRRGKRYAQKQLSRKTRRTTIPHTHQIRQRYDARLLDGNWRSYNFVTFSSHPGSPLVRFAISSLGILRPASLSSALRSLATAQVPGSDPSGSTQWSLSPQGGIIAPNWYPASSANRASHVVYAFCVLARGIRWDRTALPSASETLLDLGFVGDSHLGVGVLIVVASVSDTLSTGFSWESSENSVVGSLADTWA